MSETSLADRSIEQVRTWIDPTRAAQTRADAAATPLGQLAEDPAGLDFIVQFIDLVIRPEDPEVAAAHLRRLSQHLPPFLSATEGRKLRFGARFSSVAPAMVQRKARQQLRESVGHLVLDAENLRPAIADLTRAGDRLNLNLLGEAVLGESEAVRHRDRVIALLARDDVDYVSVKVSSIASQLSLWSFDATVDRVVDRLLPLLAEADANGTFVNLDMEAYRDLDLTVEVFMRALDRFPELQAGLALQAYVPDSLGHLQRIQEWAAARRADGGAPVKVRIVKGANLGLEHVDSVLRGWPEPTWPTKRETDTHFKRMLHWAMTPERLANVHVGVATHNLFDIAYAWQLAGDHGISEGIEFEALHGFDDGPMRAVRRDVGPLRLYTPVVAEEEFDTAIAYLVRRLQESVGEDQFLASLGRLDASAVLDREADRFVDSVKALDDAVPAPRRTQNRVEETPRTPQTFSNAPDTDPSLAANRRWAEVVASRSTYTELGKETVRNHRIAGSGSVESLVGTIRDGGRAWRSQTPELRSWVLHQAGLALATRRGELISVMAAETGKTFAEADTEISEAVDFAHYYAESALQLDTDGARFEPSELCVVAPPWNFPVAIPASMVLAPLAAGCGVILKPAPQSPRCAALVAEALWEAGVPEDVLGLAVVEDGDLSQALITHPSVDRVALTGSYATAELFRSWRPDLPLMAETSGKNAMVVTPTGDRDLAVADLVRSTFGNAGQKCSAASLAILVGAVGRSERFRSQLVDAASSMVVAWPADLRSSVGPLIEPAGDLLLSGLTQLDAGESWLVEPRQLDSTGRLWSPGIKTGVQPGSRFHLGEYFGPVLGIMHAQTLDEAIEWQNGTPFGLTAGIHSLDPDEVARWFDGVHAGNLYVNRPITGAVVRRQPFGGWKHSAVGPTAKAGGPNYVAQFGRWTPAPISPAPDDTQFSQPVAALLEQWSGHLDDASMRFLRAAAASDQQAWRATYGRRTDESGLGVERNVFRYLPTPVAVRSEGPPVLLARVQLAAARASAPVAVSSATPVPVGKHTVETTDAWMQRLAREHPARVRLIGANRSALASTLGGDPAVAIYADDVTGSGRVELLSFLREQSVSITNHRYGSHTSAFDALLTLK